MEEIDNGKDLHLLHVDMDRLQGKDGWNVELAVNEEMGHPMTILKVPALREEAYGQEEDSLLYRVSYCQRYTGAGCICTLLCME